MAPGVQRLFLLLAPEIGPAFPRRAAKVSDTESPVSLMSASTGVRHQVGRLGQSRGATPSVRT
jgi:hypothetical protein